MLLKQDGSVWTTGVNKYGQLGDGVGRSSSSAFVLTIVSGAKTMAAGGYHSIVLKQDGSVWTTGQNIYGQLGDGSSLRNSRGTFMKVIFGEVEVIAAGSYHSMVLTQDGGVWAAGWNKYGQLGDGSTNTSHSFVQVIGTCDVWLWSICTLTTPLLSPSCLTVQ